MKSYFLKLSGREEGPYSEIQIGQMFADQRVNRNTPCKLATGSDWKTIDDYLPMLKYGTHLPRATPKQATAIVRQVSQAEISAVQRIAVVDVDIPFFVCPENNVQVDGGGVCRLLLLHPGHHSRLADRHGSARSPGRRRNVESASFVTEFTPISACTERNSIIRDKIVRYGRRIPLGRCGSVANKPPTPTETCSCGRQREVSRRGTSVPGLSDAA
jgi:hypothetical protein